MKVTLVGHTLAEYQKMREVTGDVFTPGSVYDFDGLAEFAGRACYQSWTKPNPATAGSEGYHANTLGQGHFSIYEHASMTLYVEGVSRALTHELIRHRHLSYSQLSQRFVAEDKRDDSYVIPPALRDDIEGERLLAEAYEEAQAYYRALVEHLLGKGLPRKQAREAARAVLPNMQETKIVVTGNVRAWRDFLGKRLDPAADAEIREFAYEVLAILRDLAPHSMQDFDDVDEWF